MATLRGTSTARPTNYISWEAPVAPEKHIATFLMDAPSYLAATPLNKDEIAPCGIMGAPVAGDGCLVLNGGPNQLSLAVPETATMVIALLLKDMSDYTGGAAGFAMPFGNTVGLSGLSFYSQNGASWVFGCSVTPAGGGALVRKQAQIIGPTNKWNLILCTVEPMRISIKNLVSGTVATTAFAAGETRAMEGSALRIGGSYSVAQFKGTHKCAYVGIFGSALTTPEETSLLRYVRRARNGRDNGEIAI